MVSQGPPVGAHVTYSRQYRRCRKPGCRSCAPGQPGHGPYWYAYWREDGRQHSRYLGKQAPAGPDALTAVAPLPATETAPHATVAPPPGMDAAPPATPAPPSAAGAALRVRTLGGFALWRGEEALPTGGDRAALRLLQCLLGAPAQRLHREQLVEALWPEIAPAAGAARLRHTLHGLRRLLDGPAAAASYLRWEGDLLALVAQPGGQAPEDWLDADAFARAATAALAGRDAAACRAALALYGGDYLPGEPYAEWAVGRRETLARQHLDLLLHLAGLCREAGEPEQAEHALREALATDPCHEGAARALMELLAGSGQRGEALRVYQGLAASLDRELGLGPGPAVERLRARLLAARPVAADYTPRLRLPGRATNLPAPLSSFVGRGWELGELRALLGPTRLLTLTGSGGSGKSRLAQEVAGALLDTYPDGVWLVELAALADPALVPQAVATALGVTEQPDRPLVDAVVAFLQSRELLLLLDNCEHLLEACAALAAALLGGCPRLHILATSRQGLDITGEIAWLVPALASPGAGAALAPDALARYEAVQLFVARALERRPGFALTGENARAVAEVCARLDGIPLALELAAARLGSVSAQELAGRLGDRFALLSGGSRVALPRHQTLRATLDWSWDLLDEPARALLRRLSVFAGGWIMAAAEAICANDVASTTEARRHGDATESAERENIPVLDVLAGLVARSLVQVTERDGQSRYGLLETVRLYAAERLEAAAEGNHLRARHLAWYLALAEQAAPHLRGAEERQWLARLEAEHDNLRAALGWARDGDEHEEGLRLAAALWRFWAARGHLSEGRGWLEAALAGPGPISVSTRATALNAGGQLAYRQGDYARAVTLHEESLGLFRALGDTQGIATALGHLARVAHLRGDYAAARALNEESLLLGRELGDTLIIALSLQRLGNATIEQGEYARAKSLLEESRELFRELGDTYGIAGSLSMLGIAATMQGDYTVACALCEEALVLHRELGDQYAIGNSLEILGFVLARLGEYARATALIEESLELFREMGDTHSIAISLSDLGLVADLQGEYERAVALHEENLRLSRALGNRHGIAGTLSNLGLVAVRQGDHEQALALLKESLALSRELGLRGELVQLLECLSWATARCGQAASAARLGGAAEALRQTLGVPLRADLRAGHDTAVQAMRAALGEERFATAWSKGQAMPLEEAVALALAEGQVLTEQR